MDNTPFFCKYYIILWGPHSLNINFLLHLYPQILIY